MDITHAKISITAAVTAVGLALSGAGAYYALANEITKNEEKIKVVEARSKADSNRIREIKEKAAAAEVERKFLQRSIDDNGKKLDAILRELKR